MKQKAYFLVPACIAVVWLLFVSSAQPVTAGRGIVLRPPFDGTYRVTAYFDHDKPTYCAGANNTITIYNGESVSANCSAHTGEPYPCDGHDGWDFSMGIGTSVFAAASGQVVLSRDVWQGQEGFGKIIIISHDGAYRTMYAHLDARLVEEGESVIVGQYIARSGASGGVPAHLHFGVRHGGYANTSFAIDPFGWRGSQRDPLYDYNQKESSRLWAGAPGDSISCADFIVEDDGAGGLNMAHGLNLTMAMAIANTGLTSGIPRTIGPNGHPPGRPSLRPLSAVRSRSSAPTANPSPSRPTCSTTAAARI